MKIFDYQADALNEIIARMRAFFREEWRDLAIKPRFHTLLVGPTGVGKSTIAVQAAETMASSEREGASQPPTLLLVAAPGWMPSGGKSSVKETIAIVAEAVARNDRTLLVIDEIDKILSDPMSSWQQHCLLELLALADGRWPAGLKCLDDDDDDCNSKAAAEVLEALTRKLRETVFILGIGTFQDFFDSAGSRRTIGFGAEAETDDDEISGDDLLQKLPRELVNRFNSSLIRLPELQDRHYHLIAKQAEESLPEALRRAFSEAVAARIDGAISAKKGVRFLEEAVMEILKKLPPETPPKLPVPPSVLPGSTDPSDLCTL